MLSGMGYPPIGEGRRETLLARAHAAPEAEAGVEYPDWYLKQWHFHPDGYLSTAGARWYERVIHRLYNVGLAPLFYRAIARRLRRHGATNVVDVGCGAGHLIRTLAMHLPEAKISGVDLSPRLLARARSKLRGPARVRFIHGDATRPGVLPPDCDAVVAVHVLGHVPRQVARDILREACGAMSREATLLTVEHRWHAPPPVPRGLQLWRRRGLAGGMLVLREYGRVPRGEGSA